MNPKSLIPITTAIFLILLTIPTHACSETHGCFQVTWKPIYMGLFTQKYLINIKNICDSTNYTNTSLVIYNASFDGRVTIHTYRIFTQIKTITKPIYNKIINQTYNFTTNPWNITVAELYNFTNQSGLNITSATLSWALSILTCTRNNSSCTYSGCYYLNNQSFNCETLAPNYVNQTITEPFYKPIPTKLLYDQNGTYIFNITDNIYNPYETKQFLIKIDYPYYVVNHKLHLSADVAIAIDNYLYHPWFNTSWGARYPLYINNTPRVVKLNITWVTDMQGNFSDLRFTYYNPITQNETELPYWISYYQPYKYAIVYVRLNPPVPINTNNATIYVYYDNPTAPPASNFTATITEIPMQINFTTPVGYAFGAYYKDGNLLWLSGLGTYKYPSNGGYDFAYVYGYVNLTNTSDYKFKKAVLKSPVLIDPLATSVYGNYPTGKYYNWPYISHTTQVEINHVKYIVSVFTQDENKTGVVGGHTANTTIGTIVMYYENNLSLADYFLSPVWVSIYNISNGDYAWIPTSVYTVYHAQGIYHSIYNDSVYIVGTVSEGSPPFWPMYFKSLIYLVNLTSHKYTPIAYFYRPWGKPYLTGTDGATWANVNAFIGSVIGGFYHITGPYYAILYNSFSYVPWWLRGVFGTTTDKWSNVTVFLVYLNGTQFKFLKNITISDVHFTTSSVFYSNSSLLPNGYCLQDIWCPSLQTCYIAMMNATTKLTYIVKVNMTSGNHTILTSLPIPQYTGWVHVVDYLQNTVQYMTGMDNGSMLYLLTGPFNQTHILYDIKTNTTYLLNMTLMRKYSGVFDNGLYDHIMDHGIEETVNQDPPYPAIIIHDAFANWQANQTNISIWTIPVFAQPAINVTLDYKVKQGYYQWYINSPPIIKILYPFTDAYTNLNLIRIYASDDNSKILNVTVYMYGQVIYQNSSYINGTSVNIWYPAPSTITPYVVYAKASDGTLTSYSDYIYFHYVPPSYTNYEIGSEATYSVNGYPSMSIGYIPNITMPGLNTMSEPYYGYSKEKMQEQKEKEMKNKKMKKKKHSKGDLIVTPDELDFYFPGPNMCSTSSVTIRWMGDKPATVTTSTDITGSYVIWQPNDKFNVVLQPGESKVVKVEVCTPFNFMLWPNEASAMLLFYASSGTNMIIRPVLIRIMKGKKKMIIKKHKMVKVPKGPVGGGGGPGGWGSELAAAINKAVKYTTYLVLAIVAIVVLKMVLLHISAKGTIF